MNVTVEIIANDDSYVWGIMYRLDKDYLHTGYFCVPINNSTGDNWGDTGGEEDTGDDNGEGSEEEEDEG